MLDVFAILIIAVDDSNKKYCVVSNDLDGALKLCSKFCNKNGFPRPIHV